jgi:hypothetical protein
MTTRIWHSRFCSLTWKYCRRFDIRCRCVGGRVNVSVCYMYLHVLRHSSSQPANVLNATALWLGLRVGVDTLSSLTWFWDTNTYILTKSMEKHHLGILFVLKTYASARVHARPSDIPDKQMFRGRTSLLNVTCKTHFDQLTNAAPQWLETWIIHASFQNSHFLFKHDKVAIIATNANTDYTVSYHSISQVLYDIDLGRRSTQILGLALDCGAICVVAINGLMNKRSSDTSCYFEYPVSWSSTGKKGKVEHLRGCLCLLIDAGIEPAISWFVVKRLAIGPADLSHDEMAAASSLVV